MNNSENLRKFSWPFRIRNLSLIEPAVYINEIIVIAWENRHIVHLGYRAYPCFGSFGGKKCISLEFLLSPRTYIYETVVCLAFSRVLRLIESRGVLNLDRNPILNHVHVDRIYLSPLIPTKLYRVIRINLYQMSGGFEILRELYKWSEKLHPTN